MPLFGPRSPKNTTSTTTRHHLFRTRKDKDRVAGGYSTLNFTNRLGYAFDRVDDFMTYLSLRGCTFQPTYHEIRAQACEA